MCGCVSCGGSNRKTTKNLRAAALLMVYCWFCKNDKNYERLNYNIPYDSYVRERSVGGKEGKKTINKKQKIIKI